VTGPPPGHGSVLARLLACALALAVIAIIVIETARGALRRPPHYREISAIRKVFGRYADQAIRVVACETGGTFSVYARSGDYLGLFQMGSYARARYGHTWTALGQARAAFRYFAESGYRWTAWSCKP
jgi:hypothetical protein